MTSPISLWGIPFPHRLGLAAGLDKDGELLPFWAHLGFAFVEVGTVTPRPQSGNPRPRLFRIPRDYALLNRMGFNSAGAHQVAKNLENRPTEIIIGINIGKNKDTPLEDAHRDYRQVFEILYPYGDFFRRQCEFAEYPRASLSSDPPHPGAHLGGPRRRQSRKQTHSTQALPRPFARRDCAYWGLGPESWRERLCRGEYHHADNLFLLRARWRQWQTSRARSDKGSSMPYAPQISLLLAAAAFSQKRTPAKPSPPAPIF